MAVRTTYCQCGAMIKLNAPSAKMLDAAMAIWWRDHQGDGHGPATRAEALRARAAEEQQQAALLRLRRAIRE